MRTLPTSDYFFLKSASNLAIVFLDGPILRTFRLQLLIPRFTKSNKRGSHRPVPLSVNVGDPKRDIGAGKRNLRDPREILGTRKSSEKIYRFCGDLKGTTSPKRNAFEVSNGHGEPNENLARSERAGVSLRTSRRRPSPRNLS